MPPAPIPRTGNALLDMLPPVSRATLIAACAPMNLRVGERLYESGAAFEYVHFPIQGCVSIVASQGNARPVDVATIGKEGALGTTALLGASASPSVAIARVAGSALRISLAKFRRFEQRARPTLFRRYLHVRILQLEQNVACAHFHELNSRLARWLLTACDRPGGDAIAITHETLGQILGARRSGITLAALRLQDAGVISNNRASIVILNRKALEALSCPCYQLLKDIYARYLHG